MRLLKLIIVVELVDIVHSHLSLIAGQILKAFAQIGLDPTAGTPQIKNRLSMVSLAIIRNAEINIPLASFNGCF